MFRGADHYGVALCDDGGLFVGGVPSNVSDRNASWSVFSRDRVKGVWTLIPQVGQRLYLYGCDGENLVAHTSKYTFSWLEPK